VAVTSAVVETVVQAEVAPEPAVAAAPQPFVLETQALAAVAESAGLQWVNSDADKIRAAQEAMANELAPARVPREIKPSVSIDEGPLVLVETRKDLSQVTLPFEAAANADKPQA
jgi:ribonuclease E